MAKPTKPTPPDRALRSNPSTFSANAEAWITYQWGIFPDYIDASADFVDGRADAALAAALGGDLPPITGQALKYLRVNAGETAAEFNDVLADIPTQLQATWNAGTDTTESLLSAAKLDAKVLDQFNATGTAPLYACRAWVNFNGTGTVAIRASGNVSSITDNGTGDYTVNFTTAMPDADYGVSVSSGTSSTTDSGALAIALAGAATTTSVRMRAAFSTSAANAVQDRDNVHIAIFR